MSELATFKQSRLLEYIGEVVKKDDTHTWIASDFCIEDNTLEIEKIIQGEKPLGRLVDRKWFNFSTVQQIVINERYPMERKPFINPKIVKFFDCNPY